MPASPFAIDLAEARRYRFWFITLGVLLVVLALVALGQPVFVTIVSVMIYGILLGASGIGEIVMAFGTSTWGGLFFHLLAGTVDLLLGVILFSEPLRGSIWLTLFLGVFFLITGVIQVGFALGTQYPNWAWGVLSGVITLILGGMIWSGWPLDSLWFIGMCVGIELLFRGVNWMMLGLALGSVPPQNPTTPATPTPAGA